MYKLDITRLSEEERADVSQRIHELQGTCLDMENINGRIIGNVADNRGDLTVQILREKGYDVDLVFDRGELGIQTLQEVLEWQKTGLSR